MKKSILLSLIFSFVQLFCFSQESKTVLRSNSADIHIIYNQTTKLNWHLDPSKKPDVFKIGSSLSAKNVKFVTAIDSISFDVKAGEKINFTILLNGKTQCPTQIWALPDPLFLNNNVGFGTLLVTIIFLLFVFKNKTLYSTQTLLKFGIIAPISFWLMTLIGGFWHGNYHHLRNTISTLGEIESASENFMAVSTLMVSIFCLLFPLGFLRISKKKNLNTIPAYLSFSMAISMAWAAIFPQGHELHGAIGFVPLFMLLAAFLCIFLVKNMQIRNISIISLALMLFIFTRFIPDFQQNYEGLVQRFFYVGWSVWWVGLTVYLRKLFHQKSNYQNQ